MEVRVLEGSVAMSSPVAFVFWPTMVSLLLVFHILQRLVTPLKGGLRS